MRTVLVSGGTGALGRAVVAAFLSGGDRVVVPWIVAAEAQALEHDLETDAAERLVLVEADVADEAGASRAAQEAGPVDVLVNGVGGFAGGSPVLETPLDVWDRLYRINVRTAVALSRAILPGMLGQGSGAIVNIASQAARARPEGLAAYSAAKDAVIVLTETLHKEVSQQGVRVNAIAPSTIDTPANRQAMPDANFQSWTPPARIASVVHWLASDAAASVGGACLPV
jgi:NAD(P)-dependent dehydrogenase (short-subunit alcohol dehydrogenase family)